MNQEDVLRSDEAEIEKLKRRFNEALCDKDDEISSLRETMKNVVSSMRDAKSFSSENLNTADFFEVRSELEKYRKLLKESENGERELLVALKECKSVLKEKADEAKRLKELFKSHEDCVDSNTVLQLKQSFEAKTDEQNKTIKLNECLQQTIQERDQKIEELRLSLWEAQSYCENRSSRLKKLNEEAILAKDRELESLREEKRRLEREIHSIRHSSEEVLGLKEAELERLRKSAANFQDAVKLEDTTISKLQATLEQRERELFCTQKSWKFELDTKSDELERTKRELQEKVSSLHTEIQTIKEKADIALEEKQRHIEDLINAIDEDNRNASAEMLEKDEEIGSLKKKISEMHEVLRCKEQMAKNAEDSLKMLQDDLSLKGKHYEMEIAHRNSIMESLRKAKEISEQTLSGNIYVLQQKLNEANKEIILKGKTEIKLEHLNRSKKEKELEVAKLKKVIDEFGEENKELKERVELLNSNLEEKNSALEVAIQSVEVLKKEKKNVEEEALCLKRELSESRIKNNKYEMALDCMEAGSCDEIQDEGVFMVRKSLLQDKGTEEQLDNSHVDKDERCQVRGFEDETFVRRLRKRIEKYEKDVNVLRLRWKEKEEDCISLKTMLEESKKMVENLEARILKLSKTLDFETGAHARTAKDMQELLRMNESLLEEVQKLETLQDQQIEEVKVFCDILEKEQGDFIESPMKDRRRFEDIFGQEKLNDVDSKDMHVLLNKMKKSLFEKTKWNSKKIQEMNSLTNQTLAKKNTELKALRENNKQLQELLEKKEVEISLGKKLLLSREKYKKEMENFKEYKSKVFEEFEKEKTKLKQSTLKELASKEKEIQNLIGCSKEALKKKEDIIAGFKQFIQESAITNRNSLTKKDEIIESMEQTILALKDEKGKLQNSFNAVVARCSDVEHKVKKSEESRIRLEKDSKNFVKELESKLKQRDVAIEELREDISNERKVRKDLENEFEKLKERLKNEEGLGKEAKKIIKHLTEEKHHENKKLQAKEEQYGNLKDVLTDKQAAIQTLKQEKKNLMKENERFKNNDGNMIKKMNKKREKIEELKIMITELKEEIAQNKQKLSKTEKLNLVLQERLDLKGRETSDKEQEIRKLKMLNDKFREEEELSANRISQFETQVESLERKLQDVTQTLMEKETVNSSLKQAVEYSKSSVAKLENRIAALVEELRKSNDELTSLESEIEELREAKQILASHKEEVERIKDEEIDSLRKQLACSRLYLNQGEAVIGNVVKERDNLIQELSKTIESHKNAAFSMDSYNKSLQQDKDTILEKSRVLENELSERNRENAELKSSLHAAEMSMRFLSEKTNELDILNATLEKKQEENASLRSKIKQHEKLSEKELENNRRKVKKSEETFLKLCEDYQQLENILHQKDKELKNAQTANNKIKLENQEMKKIMENTNQMNKDIEKTMLMYKEDAERMEYVMSQLKTDNDFLQEFAKDMEKVKMKLNAAEESLEAKSKELIELREKLSLEKEHGGILENKIRDKESLIEEVRNQLETRINASEREIKELRVMLEDRTREVSLIKLERNNLEMQKREADMKIMELTNSLKNETAFQQKISERNQELELEIRQIQRDKTLGLLSPSQPLTREIDHPDLLAERSLQQKVDNISVDKIRSLHAKKAQLQVQLEQERHERVKDHAERARLKAELAIYKSLQ